MVANDKRTAQVLVGEQIYVGSSPTAFGDEYWLGLLPVSEHDGFEL